MSCTIIVIPCYNEADRLPVDAFRAFAQAQSAQSHSEVRFLFVNDGSADATEALIESLASENPQHFMAMSLAHNSGKAEAVRQGFLKAFELAPTYVGFWDADLATPLEEVPVFVNLLEQRSDLEVIFGSRVNLLGRLVQRKAVRHYLGRVFATVAVGVIGIPIYDTQCGAKLFRVSPSIKDLFREPFISRWIFDVEIIARLIRSRRDSDLPPAGEVIYEQPLDVWRDVAGSKLRHRDFLIVGSDLARIYLRYMRT